MTEIECEGCIRGLRTFRRGPNMDTERWHRDGDREFLCTALFEKWGIAPPGGDVTSREMHANMIKGVELCFTPEEWHAASQEMHDSGNSSWVGVVRIAIENLRQLSAAGLVPPPWEDKARALIARWRTTADGCRAIANNETDFEREGAMRAAAVNRDECAKELEAALPSSPLRSTKETP